MSISDEAAKAAEMAAHDAAPMWRWSEMNGDESREFFAEVLEAAAPYLMAQALQEAADEAEAVIACGDVAEVAAPVEGEVGRSEAVSNRDVLYEEPVAWLRDRAESYRTAGVGE